MSVKRVLCWLFALAAVFMLTGAVYMLGGVEWQEFDETKITNANKTLLIYDGDGELVSGVYGSENRIPVKLSNVSEYVTLALISTEDTRFYRHNGIDLWRIAGALAADIKAGAFEQGASTLTQQLVKLSHLTPEKTFKRKLQEAVLAIQLEKQYTKDQILEMYLNFVYFGAGAYGIETAAQTYFSKSASDLTVSESALLAGLLKAPSRYAPHLNMQACIERRNLVIGNMLSCGFITEAQAQAAKQEEIALKMRDYSDYPHGFYIEYAMAEARAALGVSQEELLSGGYRLYTALDTGIQTECERLFADDELFPAPVNGQKVQGALVIMQPSSHSIAAMLGGREHEVKLGLNRADSLRRQPGSAIKPIIVYAPALESFGYTAASVLSDKPVSFAGYTPRNYGGTYNGSVTLRTALAKSLNVPAVEILADIGVGSARMFAQKLGITFDAQDDSLALALGGFTYGVTTLELCGAYAAFADSGQYAQPYSVLKITDAAGKTLHRAECSPVRVMSAESAFILTSMLQSVVTEGTGRRMNIGIPLAGKTGTTGMPETGGNKDAWVAAYNTQYAAALWMGLDDAAGGSALPDGVTGGTYPAALMARVFSYIYKDGAGPGFTRPAGVRQVRLDKKTLSSGRLMLASGLTPPDSVTSEYFTTATAPRKLTDYWVVPEPAGSLTAVTAENGKPRLIYTPKEKFVLYRLYRQQGLKTVLLAEYPGDAGTIEHTDHTAEYGKRYSYYILPVHPELAAGDVELKGASSKRVSFMCVLPEAVSPAAASGDQRLAPGQ